jgi:hypothetical protein
MINKIKRLFGYAPGVPTPHTLGVGLRAASVSGYFVNPLGSVNAEPWPASDQAGVMPRAFTAFTPGGYGRADWVANSIPGAGTRSHLLPGLNYNDAMRAPSDALIFF